MPEPQQLFNDVRRIAALANAKDIVELKAALAEVDTAHLKQRGFSNDDCAFIGQIKAGTLPAKKIAGADEVNLITEAYVTSRLKGASPTDVTSLETQLQAYVTQEARKVSASSQDGMMLATTVGFIGSGLGATKDAPGKITHKDKAAKATGQMVMAAFDEAEALLKQWNKTPPDTIDQQFIEHADALALQPRTQEIVVEKMQQDRGKGTWADAVSSEGDAQRVAAFRAAHQDFTTARDAFQSAKKAMTPELKQLKQTSYDNKTPTPANVTKAENVLTQTKKNYIEKTTILSSAYKACTSVWQEKSQALPAAQAVDLDAAQAATKIAEAAHAAMKVAETVERAAENKLVAAAEDLDANPDNTEKAVTFNKCDKEYDAAVLNYDEAASKYGAAVLNSDCLKQATAVIHHFKEKRPSNPEEQTKLNVAKYMLKRLKDPREYQGIKTKKSISRSAKLTAASKYLGGKNLGRADINALSQKGSKLAKAFNPILRKDNGKPKNQIAMHVTTLEHRRNNQRAAPEPTATPDKIDAIPTAEPTVTPTPSVDQPQTSVLKRTVRRWQQAAEDLSPGSSVSTVRTLEETIKQLDEDIKQLKEHTIPRQQRAIDRYNEKHPDSPGTSRSQTRRQENLDSSLKELKGKEEELKACKERLPQHERGAAAPDQTTTHQKGM